MAERGDRAVPMEEWIPERPFDSAEYLDGQAPGYEGDEEKPMPQGDDGEA